jgi:predicted SAM-dependent methyltransferase
MNIKCVQYGCGFSAPSTCRNFDASPTLRFERIPIIGSLYTKNKSRFPWNVEYGDIVNGLPVPQSSTEAVYCSHILEHLSLEDLKRALIQTHNMLTTGGCFRLVLPDLEYSITQYIKNPSPEAALNFMNETSLGKNKRSRNLKGFISEWMGNSQHYWMWDYKSLCQELEAVGFENIRRAKYGDSKISIFKDVEDKERWENCLGIECFKV